MSFGRFAQKPPVAGAGNFSGANQSPQAKPIEKPAKGNGRRQQQYQVPDRSEIAEQFHPAGEAFLYTLTGLPTAGYCLARANCS